MKLFPLKALSVVLLLRLSEVGPRGSSLPPWGLGRSWCVWWNGVQLGISDELPPIDPTLLTVRPKTFTSRLLSDPWSQVHQSQKQNSARNSRKNKIQINGKIKTISLVLLTR